MEDQTYINRLKKNLRHPRVKIHWRIAGVMLIFLGVVMAGTELWKEFQSDKLNEVIKTEFLPALSNKERISTDDLSAFHSLIIAQAKMEHSSSGSMIGGLFIGWGVVMLMGIFTKSKEISFA